MHVLADKGIVCSVGMRNRRRAMKSTSASIKAQQTALAKVHVPIKYEDSIQLWPIAQNSGMVSFAECDMVFYQNLGRI